MAILGFDTGDDDIVGSGTPDKPGQDKEPLPKAPTDGTTEIRSPSPTPEGKTDNPLPTGSAAGKSSFGRYQGHKPKLKVGYPCSNCPHSHMDHGMYDRHLCLMDDCGCIGLKIEAKEIPSRMDDVKHKPRKR